jgi:hypothetical protein
MSRNCNIATNRSRECHDINEQHLADLERVRCGLRLSRHCCVADLTSSMTGIKEPTQPSNAQWLLVDDPALGDPRLRSLSPSVTARSGQNPMELIER